MSNTTNEEQLLREKILSINGMCSGPYEHPHRCSAMHCDHCGLCDYSEEFISLIKKHTEMARLEGKSVGMSHYNDAFHDLPAPDVEAWYFRQRDQIDEDLEAQKQQLNQDKE